jgi:hypothetical protein
VRDGQNKIQIIYSSHRQMCGLLEGIVDGLAKQFREIIKIEKTACMLEGAPYCVFELTKLGNYDETVEMVGSLAQTKLIEPEEHQTIILKDVEVEASGAMKLQLDQALRADVDAIKLLAQVNANKQLAMIKHFRVVSMLGAAVWESSIRLKIPGSGELSRSNFCDQV